MRKQLLYESIYLLSFLSVSFLSCKKSMDTNTSLPVNSFPVPAATPVNGSVVGRVFDENFTAVAAATVECAGITTTTDAGGFFHINNATLDKYITTLTVTRPGYFKGYRSFCANPSRNMVNIKLIPRILAGSIEATTGGGITLPNSSAMNFQENSIIIKNTGAPYIGIVNVYAGYIDPTNNDIGLTVPGSFTGTDGSSLYALKSTAMIAIEMESPTGESLQLVADKPATIKLSIPSSIISLAPNTIDTWSLDDRGIWVKEGTAAKTGGHYEFLANHFSFWNCDQPSASIYLNINVQEAGTGPLINAHISLISQAFGMRSGTTDASGNVSGLVPANEVLRFEITGTPYPYPYPCTTPSFTENVGPFTTNASLTITTSFGPNQTGVDTLSISGTANDCNGQPIQNGHIEINNGLYFTYANVVNGSYAGLLTYCSSGSLNAISVKIYDSNSTAESTLSSYPVTGTTMTLPVITLSCGSAFNNYDGIYEATGTFSDITNAAFTGIYPQRIYLVTTGAYSVVVKDSIDGSLNPGYIFNSGGWNTFYPDFGLQLSFDPSTNTIADLHNYYGDPANSYTAVGDPLQGSGAPNYQAAPPNFLQALLDPSGLNSFNPSTRVIKVKYFMNDALSPTNPRCSMDETWTYIGPR